MKIAVFSDVQANLPAMETVVEHIQSWNPDLVVMNGDLINRGPSSPECLAMFDQLRRNDGWLPIKGNHEEYVLHCGATHLPDGVDAALRQFADWTATQLGDQAELMRDWPDHLTIQGPNDDWIHLTHGSMAGNRIGITASLKDTDLAERVPDDVALFVVAHTHKPLERRYGNTRILNVGSAGSPFDGDIRGSWARIEHRGGRWETEIVRFAYDRERTERDFRLSGFLEEGGPLAGFIFEEWKRAELMMPLLRERYIRPLVNGDVDLDQAVAEFLNDLT
jgi:predicted phosphodiesterase